MTRLGRFNRLHIVRRADIGLFLDAAELGEILLPRRYVTPSMQPGGEVDVFVHHDSEDRIVATTLKPKIQVGQCAYLKVVGTGIYGAFLDWGLPKDLLAPHAEQQTPMQKGFSYAVYAFVDEATQRIAASSRLQKYLSSDGRGFKPREAVECLIYGKSDLGFKAIVNQTHLGQFFDSETFRPLHYGESLQAYIKQVRKDGKIDLALSLPSHLERDRLSAAIIEHLQQNHGISTLTDKSAPDDIYRAFGVSKASYKKALGQLYKQRAIKIGKDRITLL